MPAPVHHAATACRSGPPTTKRTGACNHPSQVQRSAHLTLTAAAMVTIYATCIAIALTVMPRHPSLGLAIAFDLTVTAGLVFWWLAVRLAITVGELRDRPAGSAVAEKAAVGGSSAGDGGNAPRPGQSSNTGHTDAKEES